MPADFLDALRRKCDRTLIDLRAAERTVEAEAGKLQEAKDRLAAVTAARDLVQHVAQQVQEEAHAQIGGLVTRALKAVFGSNAYEFKIVFDRKRGKTEARLVFVRDGEEINPMDAAGGGTIAVAAFALRLSCLILQQPPVRRLLVLDEPFSAVSKEYRPNVRLLLESLAEEMDLQIVMVSHATDFMLGTVIKL